MDREAHDDELGEDDREPRLPSAYASAPVLGLTALVLAVASLLGFGLLNGSSFLAQDFSGEPDEDLALKSALLGAALALLPLGLGLQAARTVDEDDPAWTAVLARTAVLVAAVSLVARLVVAATASGDGFPRF